MTVEREIKFTVRDRAVFAAIAALTEIAGYRLIDHGIRRQVDTCFDTPDFQLFHGKVVLRLRRWDDRAVVTFKSHGGVRDGVYHRTEIETPVDPASVDPPVTVPPACPALDAFRGEFGDVELRPSLTVTNHRHIFDLVRDDTVCYELALDDVIFSGPDGEARVLELEVEARQPDDRDLPAIGTALAGRFRLEPAGPSKYVRGMELVGGV